MDDHKQYFKREMEIYFQGRNFKEDEKWKYIKKVKRDKEYKQKLLSNKSEAVAIEIAVLNELLEEAKAKDKKGGGVKWK